MGAPFYLEYLLEYEDGIGLEDVTKQFILCEKHTRDEKTGLLRHAWDEKRNQPWCDPVTGQSPSYWARSWGGMSWRLRTHWNCCPKAIQTETS